MIILIITNSVLTLINLILLKMYEESELNYDIEATQHIKTLRKLNKEIKLNESLRTIINTYREDERNGN